ncbi:uncharacterized protein [Syngnathus scovelli]|uniref:uncharacterized protein n=1 Tax=Syngnathus scovelli TaxID=161590 RepID=UPI0035CB86FA
MLNNPPEDAPRKPGIFPKTKKGKPIKMTEDNPSSGGGGEEEKKKKKKKKKKLLPEEAKVAPMDAETPVLQQQQQKKKKKQQQGSDAASQKTTGKISEKKRRRSRVVDESEAALPAKIRKLEENDEVEFESNPPLEGEHGKENQEDPLVNAKESVGKMQKKVFTSALTRAQVKKDPPDLECRIAARNLVDERRFSNLTRLVKVVAQVWRAAKHFAARSRGLETPKWEAVSLGGVITVTERQDALRDLFLAAQGGVTFPTTTTDRLVVFKEEKTGLLVCGGRVQAFNEDRVSVPLLPYSAWISTLLVREAHSEGHEGIAATLLKVRKRAWVIKGRRIAQKVIDNCVICKKARARRCQQVMGDLPQERTRPAAPFEFTAVDLFGPYQVKDDVRKRVRLKEGDIVWLCDQNALRGHFKLGRVISVNPDSRGIVRDVTLRVVRTSCAPEIRPTTSASKHPTSSIQRDHQSTILHRDVRRLVVLLPVEEQTESPKQKP